MNEKQQKAKALVEQFIEDCKKAGCNGVVAGVSFRDPAEPHHDWWWTGHHGPCLTVVGLGHELHAVMANAMRFKTTDEPTRKHPVDALKEWGAKITPNTEAELRKICDEFVRAPTVSVPSPYGRKLPKHGDSGWNAPKRKVGG